MASLDHWTETSICLLAISLCLLVSRFPSGHAAEHVCNNIDVRNSVHSFHKLENCTVVEGFLQIVLIDNGDADDYKNISFPNLREITGYLFLYRAFGLQSLRNLFPNLAVIRGSTLFHNYALVVFEMVQLEEIGLGSLTHILRGSVRIEKNPALCYVDTVDWDRVAPAGRGGHFIKDNKPREQCPDTCPSTCPTNPQCPHYSSAGDGQCRLCWGANTCQKVCPAECESNNRSCMPSSNECCNKECIGGCFGTTASDCMACRRVSYENRCFETCPLNTFEYLGRRCLNELECKAISAETALPNQQVIHWKPFDRHCREECPPHYTEKSDDKNVCVRCISQCPKVCPETVVDSVSSAQNLRGCTIINGSLEIQIQGGSNIIRELEENLNSIQEIKGYLKVARSNPLVSLNFLKNLTFIRGEMLDRKAYSLLVLENQNLQELWDEHRPSGLRIESGKFFFHFNAKLCLSKIQALGRYAKVDDSWDDRDVSPSTNGDRVACDVTTINITIWKMSSNMVGVQWDNFRNQLSDTRSLLGYVIYYREAPFQNISIYDGRDACGTDEWKVDDVEATESHEPVKYLITNLKPYTQYAIYISTFTVASAEKGAQSQIMYITTKPDTPTFPVNVRAYSTQLGEIFVHWKPPKLPNGNVTHYIVSSFEKKESSEGFRQRNYCQDSSTTSNFKKPAEPPQKVVRNSSEPTRTGECCICEKPKPKLQKEEEAESQILFENFVHNTIYIKNPHVDVRSSGSNRKRAISTRSPGTHVQLSSPGPTVLASRHHWLQSSTGHPPSRAPVDDNSHVLSFHDVVYNQLYIKISNLKHFTEYTIKVSACQDENPDLKERCSIEAMTSVRTLPMGGADDIEGVSTHSENASLGSMAIKWEEPRHPNSLIVAYHIEYKKVDSINVKPFVVCISQSTYNRTHSYSLTGLSAGNYSLKIRATSLAGDGNWSTPVYFLIPESPNDTSPEILAVIIVFVALFLIVVIGVGMWVVVKRKFGPGVPDGILYASVNPEYMSAGLVYEPDEWEVPREKIKLIRELGQGSFGMVYEGEARDIVPEKDIVQCAVKTVNESSSLRERIEFLQEASVMKAFNCHHVIKLLGVVSKGHPTLVIMELMARGDLKSYLRSLRPDVENPGQTPPTLPQILQMALEIADGMAYLAAKKFVHRDLAARNCMVAKDLTVKIGDFGMTRDIYETDYYRKGGKGLLPVRWMAPESLKDGVFTSQSDVWSYGVVLWEMATLASQPYQGLSNEQVLKYVINGGVMERPENCPDRLYGLMKMCWEWNPKARPTFTELIETLLPDVGPRFQEVSFFFKQRPLMCSQDNGEEPEATPSTPLRAARPEAGDNVGDDDESPAVNFFPSATLLPDELPHSILHSNEEEVPATRGLSSSSSEGSKGSKASNTSNGSIVNGHVHFPHNSRTTVC